LFSRSKIRAAACTTPTIVGKRRVYKGKRGKTVDEYAVKPIPLTALLPCYPKGGTGMMTEEKQEEMGRKKEDQGGKSGIFLNTI